MVVIKLSHYIFFQLIHALQESVQTDKESRLLQHVKACFPMENTNGFRSVLPLNWL